MIDMSKHPCADTIKRDGYCHSDRPCPDCHEARLAAVEIMLDAADHACSKCDCIEPEECPVCDRLMLAATILRTAHETYGGMDA